MTTFALNDNYDIYLDKAGNIALFATSSTEQIKQDITNILRLWLGEADFDVTRGVNYDIMLGKTRSTINQNVVKQNITNQLLLVNGVSKVVSVELTVNENRVLIISTQCILTSGATINATN